MIIKKEKEAIVIIKIVKPISWKSVVFSFLIYVAGQFVVVMIAAVIFNYINELLDYGLTLQDATENVVEYSAGLISAFIAGYAAIQFTPDRNLKRIWTALIALLIFDFFTLVIYVVSEGTGSIGIDLLYEAFVVTLFYYGGKWASVKT